MDPKNFFTELKRRNVCKLAVSFVPCGETSPLFEVALVLVRLDHVGSFIVLRELRHHVIGLRNFA
jgi:hypothetical protein